MQIVLLFPVIIFHKFIGTELICAIRILFFRKLLQSYPVLFILLVFLNFLYGHISLTLIFWTVQIKSWKIQNWHICVCQDPFIAMGGWCPLDGIQGIAAYVEDFFFPFIKDFLSCCFFWWGFSCPGFTICLSTEGFEMLVCCRNLQMKVTKMGISAKHWDMGLN